jgi:PAS domain S-box-containing protein
VVKETTGDAKLRYQAIFDNSIDGIILINGRGIIADANGAVTKLFGYQNDEMIGKNISMLMPEPDHSNHDKYLENYQRTRKAKIIGIGREVRGKKKDGTTFPFRLAVSEIQMESGLMYTGIVHDLSAEKAVEEKLEEHAKALEEQVVKRTNQLNKVNEKLKIEVVNQERIKEALTESQKLYEAIAVNFPNGTINVLDRKFNFLFVEGAGLKDLGLGTKDLLGKCYLDIIRPEVRDLVTAELKKVMDGMSVNFEVEINRHIYRVRAVPLTKSEDEIDRILLVESNITNQKRAEEEIYRSLQKEKELNEMKSRFVSMASHEFRTPLSTILSSASLIEKYKEGSQQEQRSRHSTRIKNNVRNLTMILNDFLSLEKLEANSLQTNLQVFDLRESVMEVKEDMETVTRKGQEIVLECSEKQCLIKSDPFIIQNILNNLMSNAIKYSNEDTKILVSITHKEDGVHVSVADQGRGISEEDQLNLFNRFYRASNAGNVQGTGLGLHIIKRYVALIGAQIQFTSELGKGSVFTIILHNN